MAFSATLTGTARSCTLTSGQSTITVSSASQLVVGSTIQGTGIPTGTRIGKIVSTTVTLVNASGVEVTATASGSQNLIFSSVFGSLLTISLSASGDYATPQNIYDAGFGIMSDNIAKRELFFPGGLQVKWANIVSGAIFDFLNWALEFGTNGWWRFQESSILGELRGGYLVNGTQFIKTVGPTFYSNNWNAGSAGGSSMFENLSGTTNQGLFRMHNMRVVVISGANASPSFSSARMTMNVENLIVDYQGDSAGANAGVGAAFGTLKNTYLVKTNGSLNQTNGSNYATFDGLIYTGNYQSSPQHKFNLPQAYTIDGYSPQVLSNQFLGGFNSATLETYSNINLSSAGWGLNDLKTKYLRYFGPITLQFPRRVSFEFNDSTATNLTGVTLYIKSGSVDIINAVQSGDYSANTQALNLVWSTSVASYRVCNSFVDTISQIAQVRKYGYIEQSTSYSLNTDAYSQPFFMLADASLSGISEATASAITTAGINWTTKTITPTADLTYDQINARIAWELAQTTNSAQAEPRTINGTKVSLATGWTLVVNTGRTISAGTNITEWYTPTITINGTGKIDAVYQTTVGTSTIWEFGATAEPIIAGTSLAIYDSTGTTKYYNAVTTDGVYRYYIAPQSTGATYTYAIERYGYKREEGTFPSNAGGILFYVPSYGEDVGITESTLATVQGYTTLSDTAQIYDATANFRLSETGIKLGQLVARDGTYLDFGNFNVKIKDDASAIVAVVSGTITYKSIIINESTKYNAMKATPPKTITPTDTEIINVLIEDANGDSKLAILGGDNLGYELWKITTATATDDYATGTLLTTLATNDQVFRFIGVSGFDIVGRDISSGVRRRTSMLKGSYEQAFYVGNQIQLATDAPQLIENNEKLAEVILKLDTNLDAKVSTRLADADYIDPATAQDVWEYTTRTLTSAGASGATLAEIEGSLILAKEATSQDIKANTDKMQFNTQNHIAANVHQLQAGAIADIQDGLALETTSQDIYTTVNNTDILVTHMAGNDFDGMTDSLDAISTKVDGIKAKTDTLENYNDTTLIQKVDAIQTSVDNIDVDFTPVLEAVDLTLKTSEYTAPDNTKISEIKTKVDTLQNADFTNTNNKIDAIGSAVIDLEASSQSIQTKVNSLENYNDATAQSKLDAIKAKTDNLVNTDLTGIATTTDVATAKTEILEAVNDIEIDNEAIATEVWNQEPERLKQVATVQTTGEQIASFNTL